MAYCQIQMDIRNKLNQPKGWSKNILPETGKKALSTHNKFLIQTKALVFVPMMYLWHNRLGSMRDAQLICITWLMPSFQSSIVISPTIECMIPNAHSQMVLSWSFVRLMLEGAKYDIQIGCTSNPPKTITCSQHYCYIQFG